MNDAKITEIDDTVPYNPPVQISASGVKPDEQKIEMLEASSLDEEDVTILPSDKDREPTVHTVGQPLTDDDKRLAKPIPENILPNEPKGKILTPGVTLEDIPGIKEVKILAKDQPYKDMQVSVPEAVKNNLSARKFFKEMLKGGVINQIIHKFGLEGIDLDAEKIKIEKKESHLSASKRKAVIALCNMRMQQKALMKDVAKNFLGKEDPSDEELKALLDSVEDNITNIDHAAEIVAQEVVDRAQKTLEEAAKPKVEETLKEAEVTYEIGSSDAFQEQYSKLFGDTSVKFNMAGHLESNDPNDVFGPKCPKYNEGDVFYYTTFNTEDKLEELHELVRYHNTWWKIEDGINFEFTKPEVDGVHLR